MADVAAEKAGLASEAARRAFNGLLANTLASGVTSSFLWFALTFWVYLETRSVVATGIIAGSFSITSAVIGPFFGTFVDRHRKKVAMAATTATSLACFLAATTVFVLVDASDLLRIASPWFWIMILLTLAGSTAGGMRAIALSTCVTLLVPEERRDRANGLVGTVGGVSFAITSVFSGLVIGNFGMGVAYYAAVALTLFALVHLLTIVIPGDVASSERAQGPRFLDARAALDAIRAVPGLFMLIGLAAFNNFLAGVFMALMDPYGLELVSVEVWGLLWGVLSMAFIVGGVAVARFGLGGRPVRLILAGNMLNWVICSVFTLRASIVLLCTGMFLWLAMMPMIEAAEQTVLQKAIPFERQGRVFGFAQFLETAASPITAFLVAPLAETVFIPLMTDGRGAELIGGWFGTGTGRGLALMFTLAGLIGVVATAIAWSSRAYRSLSAATAAVRA